MLLIYLLTGCFAGFIAGLLGVGGGLIIVPALAWVFVAEGFPSQIVMHMAIGTSLATIVITSLSSTFAHHRRGSVRWPEMRRLTLGILAGAWLGSLMADRMSGTMLAGFFGFFECFVAIQMYFSLGVSSHSQSPTRLASLIGGLVIGTVSAVLGIGGGTLTVPFLIWHQVSMREAVATSAACGLPIALMGALGFVYTGLDTPVLPAGSTGYLYWPAFVAIVTTSVLMAPFGARLAHRLPQQILRKVFAVFLACLGVVMLVRLSFTVG
ncbi:MAG: sulfite exporter TauE/SafE family protein [Gammaproteobacteria bacterium]